MNRHKGRGSQEYLVFVVNSLFPFISLDLASKLFHIFNLERSPNLDKNQSHGFILEDNSVNGGVEKILKNLFSHLFHIYYSVDVILSWVLDCWTQPCLYRARPHLFPTEEAEESKSMASIEKSVFLNLTG